MTDSLEKGNDLELAVRAIEETILLRSPGLAENSFRIESKRLFLSEDVKHEIDLWVSVDIGKGYEAIFIFECKNWKEKVGKNEIIIFSEKIRATNAQRGFFVAKSFTKDAIAQAAKDTRVQLLVVSEMAPSSVPIPYEFHLLMREETHINLAFEKRIKDDPANSKRMPVTEIVFDGEKMSIQTIGSKWADEIWEQRSNAFRSERMPPGIHPLTADGKIDFEPSRLTIDGYDIAAVAYKCEFNARVIRPAVESYFDVETRGRSLRLAPIQLGTECVQLRINMVFPQ